MSESSTYVPPISPGRPGAPIGSREWADWIRTTMVAKAQHLGEEDSTLVQYIELAKKHRAWTLMNKRDGSFFSSLEEFCAEPRPYGLGTTWAQLKPFLVAGMTKAGKSTDEIERTLQLEAVPVETPPARRSPGRPRKEKDAKGIRQTDTPSADDAHSESTQEINTRNECGILSQRSQEQLRAITRAPEAVQDAYRQGRISQTLAAKLGPKNPDPDTAAVIAEVAREVRKAPDRKAADALVRAKLGTPAPGPVERAIKAVEKLTQAQRADFFQRVERLRLDAEAFRLTGGMK